METVAIDTQLDGRNGLDAVPVQRLDDFTDEVPVPERGACSKMLQSCRVGRNISGCKELEVGHMKVVQVSGKAIRIEAVAIHISYCEKYASVFPLKPSIFHLADRNPSLLLIQVENDRQTQSRTR